MPKPRPRRTSAPTQPHDTRRVNRPTSAEGPQRRARKAAPRPKQPHIEGEERLQKILAHAGIASRRACEEIILQGRVTVDGKVIRELGIRVDPTKVPIAIDGQKIREERHVYYAVNKPKGYVSTNDDPSGRPRVVDLLPEIPQRVYSVGRLDEMSVGLMLLTNDGELANKLSHPKFGVEKVYRAVVAGLPTPEVLDQVVEGVWLAEGKVRARHIKIVARKGDSTVLDMVLAEGKNREVRRMLAKLGHKVMALTRVAIGPISLKGLNPGTWRPLRSDEVDLLRRVAAGQTAGIPRFGERKGSYQRPRVNSDNSVRPQGRPQGSGGRSRPGIVPPRPADARGPLSQGGPRRLSTPPAASGPPASTERRVGGASRPPSPQSQGPPRRPGGPTRPGQDRPSRPGVGRPPSPAANRRQPPNREPARRIIGLDTLGQPGEKLRLPTGPPPSQRQSTNRRPAGPPPRPEGSGERRPPRQESAGERRPPRPQPQGDRRPTRPEPPVRAPAPPVVESTAEAGLPTSPRLHRPAPRARPAGRSRPKTSAKPQRGNSSTEEGAE